MSDFKLENDPTQGNLFDGIKSEDKPVTCLGQTFPSDAARRAHFTALLAEKLKDPEFRKIEGFPIGKDEDILALSDPPYYCACPNPWLGDFIKEWEAAKPKRKGKYEREPFAADVSEGKNDPIYNAHSYHTKVPHKAIMRYILHYTEPGDIVFDGFCGTGMTGVAAQMCGDKKTVESLGYKVDEKGNITDPHAEDPKKVISHLGARKAVLNDLSPAATYIAHNYNKPHSASDLDGAAKKLNDLAARECSLYSTRHIDGSMGRINYTIWSDVVRCSSCSRDFVFWDHAVDVDGESVKDKFRCPHCGCDLNKNLISKVMTESYDAILCRSVAVARQVPVLISYSVGKRRFVKTPDKDDVSLLDKISSSDLPFAYSPSMLPVGENTRQPLSSHGFSHVHQFYTHRSLRAMLGIRSLKDKECDWANHASMFVNSYMNRWPRQRGPLNGTLYVGAIKYENNVFKVCANKLFPLVQDVLNPVETVSMSAVSPADNSFDYIFLDPPFGANINYSQLNYLWESWYSVFTNTKPEAIENDTQGKDVSSYRTLMRECFSEAYRVLKPAHWLTVEFSNTSASIWNSIQTALSDVGFIVANVSGLDKKQGSFKAQTTPTAVKQDLVISAYKPDADFEKRFKDEAATEDGVWDFVRTHLEKLPVSKVKMVGGSAQLQVISERDPRILFDKVVAYYFRNGFPIPVSAKEFQDGLRTRFTEDDGMFFLPEQHAEYLKQKAKAEKLVQAELFVSDESSAIAWLRQKLKEKPQKMQSVQPEFMQQIQAWNKYEQQLELKVLLEQNFLCYDGRGPVPNPIHAYLSTQYHELRNLKDDAPALVEKAKNLWYVPDPRDAAEVEKMRERALLKEYETYKTEKKIKTPRLEALRLGFQKSYEAHDYAAIVSIAKKLPADVVETDEKLLRYFDRAQLHLED